MRAVVVRAFEGPEVHRLEEMPIPVPGPGQVRIRAEAATVNPVDAGTRSGALAAVGLMSPREVTGIGWDVAGVVDAIGPQVDGLAPGLRVIGQRPARRAAGHLRRERGAGRRSRRARARARARGRAAAAAATLPLNGLTAVQSLDLLDVKEGGTVLVTGAGGALGGFAVELATLRGLRVVAAAGAEDEELVRSLGATWFVPRGPGLGGRVRELVPSGVDGALDAALVGIGALEAVRNCGAFVSVVAGAAPVPLRGIRVAEQWITADARALAELASLAETGRLTLRVAGTLPLEEAARAPERLDKGGLRGRLVLTP